jgi:inosose dehydratase
MSERSRRHFLASLGAVGVTAFGSRLGLGPRIPTGVRVGYAAITWGGQDDQAIDDIADVGFRGIQLRATVMDAYAGRPAALRKRLADRGLTFAVLSSGNLRFDPADEREQLDLHVSHAAFVRDAGGQYLQVIDEKPRNRATSPEDYTRLGQLMSELGRRIAAIGVPLVYHHHMNSLGQAPEAIDAILSASDRKSVGLLLDIGHYQQGGGDPVAAIRRYRDRIRVVHLKDVERIETSPGYRWVELGRGRVDVKGCVTALRDVGFAGWAIVELDRVVAPAGSPKASAQYNRDYVVNQLRMTL